MKMERRIHTQYVIAGILNVLQTLRVCIYTFYTLLYSSYRVDIAMSNRLSN